MDDVLDSVRFIHVYGDIHGRVPIMVPVLLRGEDCVGAMAAVASNQGLLHTVPEVRASGALQTGTGKNQVLIYDLFWTVQGIRLRAEPTEQNVEDNLLYDMHFFYNM